MTDRRLLDELTGALFWIAAFSFACGVFFCLTLALRDLPPTPPVAIGVVTIQHVSKLRDYLTAALFFVVVPPLTVWLRRLGERLDGHRRRLVIPQHRTLASILFAVPYFLSPALYLTTGKIGWVLLLPIVLSMAIPRLIAYVDGRLWVRQMVRREIVPFHALILAAAMSWILFRYLVVWKRIAHIPTLFLEIVFVLLFLTIFFVIAMYTAFAAKLLFGADHEAVLRRIAIASSLIAFLPLIALFWVPTWNPVAVIAIAFLLLALIAVRIRRAPSSRATWKLAAYAIVPALIYCVSYASSAHGSQWIDLFHRGESVGPASDYLRGKVPYRDVFVLHGMLEDGQLDAWLMQIFGRTIDISVTQSVVLGSFLALSLWYLGIILFESIPLALLVVAMAAWTTAENNRTFFQVVAVALFWLGLKRNNRLSMLASGVFAGIALFFSYEIGVYTIIGAIAAIILLAIGRRFVRESLLKLSTAAALFIGGIALGAAPFLIYLIARGASGDFFETSFVAIPRVIDAVWSLPFPDLVSTFRSNLSLHTLSDFILYEKFHLILAPLTIAVAAAYCIQRWIRRRADVTDHAVLVLTVFAAVAQRTAFGRAEFRHQYFAAFLVGPILVLLAVILTRRVNQTWSTGDAGVRAFIVATIAAMIPIFAILFWVPDLVNARIDDFRLYQARTLRVFRDGAAEAVNFRIQAVVQDVRSLTRPNEPIFDFSNQPALYFFCNRPNPTRFYQIPILSPRPFQAETIRSLERARPKVVLRRSPEGFDAFDGVPNTLRAQAVAAYLDDCYEFFRSARGIEIWKRKNGAVAGPLANYLRLIHLPGEHELVNPGYAREVFPVIGSGEGISGTYWQSDLTMHNPSRQPITVRMRYVGADQRIDRRILLAPRQTVRWDDVVRNYFRAPRTAGTLWIEYVNGRVPVVVVRTWDTMHEAHATIDTPLTMTDSATAGSATPELAIIGIPAAQAQGRRINIGVVNVGDFPATFRISARTRSGMAIGQSIESGVEEDGVWIVHDVESELKVKLDEGTMIRVTAIAGTGVAYASVILGNGDVQNIAGVPAQPK